ncbi:MAG: hypothetical protein H7338_24045, partial [Candidatus Sericytochromatia bacterium]|nr:hypothetical protein [Candidatus Sericytochromatia bacterium]
ANGAGIQSQQLQNNKDIKFSYTGLSGYWSGTTASSGQQVTGVLGIKKIAGQATDMRYSVDRFGNIFDKYGQGNTAADHYDYIPKIIDNTKGNYVGNIFGNNTRVGRKVQLDGENNRTATALGSNTVNVLDSTEKKPLLAFASRDYGRPDDLIALASATENPEVSPGVKVDNEIRNVDTFNPQFAEMYLGFSDTTQTTVGFGSGKIDGYGNRMNQIVFLPFRTANSTLADAVVNPLADRVKLMDRDYNVLGVGTKVQIVDNASGVVAGTGNPPISTGTITGLSATGEYTVSHDDPAISLDPQRQYTITTVPDPNARLAGNLENSFVSAIKTILGGNEYKEAIRAGLMEDLMLSASSSDPFGGSLSAKLTLRYNKRQERVELYQNSFAAFYKST